MSTTFTKPRPTVPPKPARLSVSAQKHNSSYSLNSITTDSKNSTDSIITNGSSSSTTSSTLTITTNTSISEMLLNSSNLTDSPTQSSPIEQNHQRQQQEEVYEEGGEQSYIDRNHEDNDNENNNFYVNGENNNTPRASEIYLPPVGRKARASYDFSGEASYRELSFKAGDVLNVLKENLAEGWSLAEKDGITGIVPESYITFTTEFTELHNAPLSSSSSLSSLSPPLLPSSPPPLSSDSDSINSTTLMSSPVSTSTEVIVNGSTTTTTTTPSSARNSTILGRRQLNRFSWFVTTGVEEFILSGGQPLLTSENHSSNDNVHHHQIERSEDEDEEQITESDKHYIESGPSWQEKAPTFKVLVHNPEKRVKLGGVQEYTIFYVTSLFTEGVQVTVERRFSQFEWLHRHLAAKFSAFILPPLPEKQYAGRFNEQFIEKRRRALERYINRLARHPVIRYSDLLTHFLSCENDNEWYKREKQFESDQIIGHVFFQHVYHPEYNVDDGDVETIERFEAHSRAMEKLMPFINEASQSHKDSVDEMQKQYRKVSYALLKLITGHNLGEGYEMLNEEGAWCWRDGCQACLSLTKALQSIAESMQSIANIYETYSNETCTPWLENMKDYSYPASNYEPLIDMHAGTYRKFKEVSDENPNNQLLEEVDLETVKSRCDTVFNVTLAEVDRIHEERVQDFREVTRQYLDGQIEFHEKVLEELRQARANFDEPHYSSLSQTPRIPNEYEKLVDELHQKSINHNNYNNNTYNNNTITSISSSSIMPPHSRPISSVSTVSEIVGGVVADGVDSLNNFLRRTTRNSISRSTVLDMWWNRNS